MREFVFTARFERLFRRLPKAIRKETYEKLGMLLSDPSHPSLRVKRIKGTDGIWEFSVTMNYRVTFEIDDDRLILRRIGTHDILRHP
jgi:mRNA interferase RelE/StbE